jgi:biotin operon repressor
MSDPNHQPTQCERILAVLESKFGQWVPMPELGDAADCYAVHSRISNLRQDGHKIEVMQRGGRKRKSWYRLVQSAPAPVSQR